MEIPFKVRQKIRKLSPPELMELAKEANNLDAYQALYEKKDFKRASELLDVTNDYDKYISMITDINGNLIASSSIITSVFKYFLTAKICYPKELDTFDKLNNTGISTEELLMIQKSLMFKGTNFIIPQGLKNKIDKYSLFELSLLAKENSTLEAFDLIGRNSEKASNLLGLQEYYKSFEKLINKKVEERLHQEVVAIGNEYRMFLWAKCCFPDEFQDTLKNDTISAINENKINGQLFHTPPAIKDFIGTSAYTELEQLAIKNNNKEAFDFVFKDFKTACELLNEIETFNNYMQSFHNYIRLNQNTYAIDIKYEFRIFLIAKCCFPDELNNL